MKIKSQQSAVPCDKCIHTLLHLYYTLHTTPLLSTLILYLPPSTLNNLHSTLFLLPIGQPLSSSRCIFTFTIRVSLL